MGIDAVALLQVPFAELTESFDRHPDLPDLLRGDDGAGFSASRLDDATLVSTFAGFADEPDEMSAALRRLLGEALDLHEDTRGIYVFPDVAEPKARSYDAVIDEIGEVGFWVPKPDAPAQPSLPQSPLDMAAMLRGAMPAGADQPALPQNPLDMAAMLQGGMPGGADLGSLLDSARQQLESLSDAEREQVATMARQFGLPISDPADLMSAMGALSGLAASGSAAEAGDADPDAEVDEADGEARRDGGDED